MPMLKHQMAFSGTSPDAPSTVIPAAMTFGGLDDYGAVEFDLLVRGATGGNLDIYFQSSVKSGRWYDVIHLPQLAAGAGQIRYQVSLSRARGGGTAAPVVVNTADGTPSLAVNTVLQFSLGDAIRLVYVAGAGTSLGAAQVMDAAAYKF